MRLAETIRQWGFRIIDTQVATPHTLAMGAEEWSRARFLERLRPSSAYPTRKGSWAAGAQPTMEDPPLRGRR